MMKLFCVLLFTINIVFASSKMIYGEGRFYAHDDDSLDFLKQQLLFSAFQDVITKELKEMNLEVDLFWQQFDDKFQKHFDPIMDKLKKRYGLLAEDEEGKGKDKKELSEKELAKKLEAYQKSLRYKKLRVRSKFGRLHRAVKSYSTIKMSRSTQYANSKYIRISATIDRKLLNQIYQKFTRTEDGTSYDTLFITTSFGLKGMSWIDLGVEIESDFTDAVKSHWKRWFKENFNTFVDKVEITNRSQEKELRSYVKLPLSINGMGGLIQGSSRIKNDLWLRVSIDVQKNGEDALMMKRSFTFDGEFILVDLRSNTLLSYYDFHKEEKKYEYKDLHALSSNAASLVYRMPMEQFEKVKRDFIRLSTRVSRIVLEIGHVSSINEVFQFNKILQERGVTMQCNPELRTFSGESVTIQVSFQGGLEQFLTLLRGMHKTAVGGKVITFRSIEKPFSLDFLRKAEGV